LKKWRMVPQLLCLFATCSEFSLLKADTSPFFRCTLFCILSVFGAEMSIKRVGFLPLFTSVVSALLCMMFHRRRYLCPNILSCLYSLIPFQGHNDTMVYLIL
jgi:hypothetical protein